MKMSNYLITTNNEKCIGCHRCIDGCPVLDANVAIDEGDKSKIYINGDKCIHCGKCFDSCKHEARSYGDDTELFFDDLLSGKQISIIAAPSIQANFPFNYKKFFGYLKSIGVGHIYDVSLGADITTWAYIKTIRENNSEALIAQPCPVVVNYIEKYQPSMIKQLAPIQSPMLCTAIYMKAYMGITHPIAAISPCIAKKDEFLDPNTHGNISYNVTFKKIEDYILENAIDIESYPEIEFENIEAEFGTLFSRPGGLKENIEYHFNNPWVRQIEGTERIFDYLNGYSDSLAANKVVPFIVDVLNCQGGCNHGTGAREHLNMDEIDLLMHQRKENVKKLMEEHMEKRKELFSYFDNNLDLKKFERTYDDKSTESIDPTDIELQVIFVDMLKITDDEQHINCSACGYKSCKDMATAIYREVNQKNNCINYNKKMVEIEKELLEVKNFELKSVLMKLDRVSEMTDALQEYTHKLEGYSMTDPLTGLCNRRCVSNKLEEETQFALRTGRTFTILLIDIDFFKKVNDEFGHDAGDYVLKEVAKTMVSSLRAYDIVSRWGGEEFLCILPETKSKDGLSLAERLREKLEEEYFNYKGLNIKITATIGVAEFDAQKAVDETIRKADVAMYKGKVNGRNTSVLAE